MSVLRLGLTAYVLSFLFLITNAEARPYVLVLVAEEATKKRAIELRDEIKNHDPFRRMGKDFVVKVTVVKPKQMGCGSKKNADGMMICDKDSVLNVALSKPLYGDAAIGIPNKKFRGHASGDAAFISPEDSVTTAIHEFMHILGFADEYDYEPTDSPQLTKSCESLRTGAPNTTVFAARSSYQSGDSAKKIHAKNIPWVQLINSETPVVSDGKLGTVLDGSFINSPHPNSPGLFAGETCKGKTVWRPFENTIMRESHRDNDIHSYGGMPSLYKAWIARAIGDKIDRTVRLKPEIDVKCFTKFDETLVSKIPGLSKFEKPLREQLEKVYPKNFNHVPAALVSAVPGLKAVVRRLQFSQECYQNLGVTESVNGDITFGDYKDETNELEIRTGMTRLMPASQLLFHIRNKLAEHADVCGAGAADEVGAKANQVDKFLNRVMTTQMILSAAEERANGRGETDRDTLAQEIHDQNSDYTATEFVKKLLTPSLYENYRKALKKYHYASYDFDCAARLKEIENLDAKSGNRPRAEETAADAQSVK